MKYNILYAITILVFLVSCKETKAESAKEITLQKQISEKAKQLKPEKSMPKKDEKPSSEWDFMKVDVENFPVTEETSFDTYDESYRENHPDGRVYTKLSKDQVRKLGLEKWLQNGSDVSVNYELPYSADFKTFVFTYQDGEMELKTAMVTFDKNFKKIDELQVAYDEIAESWLWTKSEIDKNQIVVTEYNESSGETETTKTIYKINQEGEFVKQ